MAEQTIRNDPYLLSSLIEHAQTATREDGPKGWNWKIDNPVKAARQGRRLGHSRHRDRRLSPDEYGALIDLFTRMRSEQIIAEATGSKKPFELKIAGRPPLVMAPSNALAYIPAAFLAAIESAMRREKMFNMEWSWIDWPGDIVIPDQMRGPSNKQVPSRLAAPRFRAMHYGYAPGGKVWYEQYPENGRKRFRDCVAFCIGWDGKFDGRLHTMLVPGQIDTYDADMLRDTKQVADAHKLPIQVHAGQSPSE